MRAMPSFLLLLAACLLPASALADPMDQFSITGGGLDIEFALPASTTAFDSFFQPEYGFGSVPGTVNGSPAMIGVGIVFPGNCAVCRTILLGTGSQELNIDLPSLYQLIVDPGNTETLDFLPGSYTAGTEYPQGGPTYDIIITPLAATAITPEPPSLWLFATAVFGSLVILPRRFRRVALPDPHPWPELYLEVPAIARNRPASFIVRSIRSAFLKPRQ